MVGMGTLEPTRIIPVKMRPGAEEFKKRIKNTFECDINGGKGTLLVVHDDDDV